MILNKHKITNASNIKKIIYASILSFITVPSWAFKLNFTNKTSKPLEEKVKKKHVVHRNSEEKVRSVSPRLSGKLAFNYSFDDTGINKIKHSRKYGDWQFNQFLLGLNGENNGFNYKVEYLWYNGYEKTYNQPLETYIGRKLTDRLQWQIGNTTVPFGIGDNLSWWKNIAFYAGLGDNYQAGLKFDYHNCPWKFELQAGKNSILTKDNSFNKNPKLTPDLDPAAIIDQKNEDSVQIVARLSRWVHFNENNKLELGLSGKIGNTYNLDSQRRGIQSASAVHLNAHLDKFQLQLQFIPYNYVFKYNDNSLMQANTARLAKDGRYYTIPSKANIYTAGLAYNLPVNLGEIKEITFYDDYSLLSGKRTLQRTKMNILGAKFVTTPLFLNAEIIVAKNMFGIGDPANGVKSIGSNNDDSEKWKTKFNINFGFKF